MNAKHDISELMRSAFSFLLSGLLVLGLIGCRTPAVDDTVHVPSAPPPSEPPRAQAAFKPGKLVEMDAAISQTISEKMIPGGVLWLERNGASYHKAYGNRALVPSVEAMTEDTIFDAASLTKVLAGTPAMMLLIQRGMATLDDTVHFYIAEFVGGGKEKVTIRQLLTHTSGLRPDVSMKPDWVGYDKAIELACQEKLQAEPGTQFRYSDINLFLIGDLVKRISGKPLNEFVAEEIYRPLKMNDTGFLPGTSNRGRIAPTEPADGAMLRGIVHDPTARRMGGVAGHAGLFTTASDLARFARMMLNNGELDGVRVFKPETVRLMTSVQTPEDMSVRRGLGWDIDSGYSRPRGKLFPLGSYGHTGFTGTCLWIDPFSKTFWIFLSNRVHPDGKGNVGPLQATLANLAAEVVTGFDFKNVTGALPSRATPPTRTVLNGIDVLKRQGFAPLKGLRVGLITNHTGRDREENPTIDLLKNAPGVELKVLFSPEHGIRGEVDVSVNDSVDQKTGLPVYSLYAPVPKRPAAMADADYDAFALRFRQPTAEQMKGLDALVFDIQDIGCRFYTYMSTMGGAIEAAGKAGIQIFVLDRANPINGVSVEGPVQTRHSTFVGFHSIPVRHGMTAGELAKLFNAERKFNAKLTVIPIEGWTRDLWFDQTQLPWVNPSPNIRNLTEAALYPGVGLIEFNPVSVGRGTGTPFEVVGAPWIDGTRLADELNKAGLPGVQFTPTKFRPVSSTHKDRDCAGVRITLNDREKLNAVDVGITLALTLQRLYPNEFEMDRFQKLIGHEETFEAVKSGRPLAAIKAMWDDDRQAFAKRRTQFLIYK